MFLPTVCKKFLSGPQSPVWAETCRPLPPTLPRPYLTSPPRLTSAQLISSHFTPPHLTLPPTSPYLLPHLTTSAHLISPHLISSPQLTSPHLTSPPLTSLHFPSPRLTPFHLPSPCLTSPHLTSPPTSSHPPPHFTFPTSPLPPYLTSAPLTSLHLS